MAIKRDAADKWFSDVVRQKAGFQCEHCGKKDGRMECAHIWGRAAKSVRWSMDNALCLCHYCHKVFTANPLDFGVWLQKHVGQAHMDILREKWQVLMPTNKKLRAEIAKHYREQHKLMMLHDNHLPISWN
tara:strand:- start:666 stop:1055 length:390 start_codon:yes stop_codon:yes gene_type:complete